MSLLAAAWLADGCVLIDYNQRISAAEDGGRITPVDPGDELDATPVADAGSDARAAASDGAREDARQDAQPELDAGSDSGEDSSVDEASVDAQSSDAEAAVDAMMACSTPNACGGCSALAETVGAACGACGVGRYACDGTEALLCEDDGDPASPGNPVLIDDVEDGDEYILASYGLSGAWYMVSDGTSGTLTPPAGTAPVPAMVGAAGSSRSMHFTASGFTRWGAGMSASFSAYGCGYDASKQTGIEFHMKGTGSVLVQVATKQTVPVAEHGTCTANCNDLFGVTMTAPGSWTLRKAVFANLQQAGWGTPATFDPSQILYVQFTSLPGSNLDLYVDNLSFY